MSPYLFFIILSLSIIIKGLTKNIAQAPKICSAVIAWNLEVFACFFRLLDLLLRKLENDLMTLRKKILKAYSAYCCIFSYFVVLRVYFSTLPYFRAYVYIIKNDIFIII